VAISVPVFIIAAVGLSAFIVLISKLVVGLTLRVVYAVFDLLKDLFSALKQVLAKALVAKERPGYHKHHVIAKSARIALPAKLIWTQKHKLSINHPYNIANIRVPLHAFLHTILYYKAVNKLVEEANANECKTTVMVTVYTIRTLLLRLSNYYF